MAANQLFLVHDITNAASFKSWGQTISNQLASFGWIKSTDTGQLDWNLNPAPPATGAYLWEIWHPNDALQTGASAYFLKVEYGTSVSWPGPGMRLSMGTGTNGAGTLTGFVSNLNECQPQNIGRNRGASVYDCYFSGDSGRLSIYLWRGHDLYGAMGFVVERTHNTDGTDNSDGVTLIVISAYMHTQQTLVFTLGAALLNNYLFMICQLGYAAQRTTEVMNFSNQIPISPCFPNYGKYGNPMIGIGSAPSDDVCEAGLITTTIYGVVHTYGAFSTWASTMGGRRLLFRFD